MHFHLPKPLHGWREFAGEVGIIVVGVLIALGAEQVVQAAQERRLAAEARSNIKAEIDSNLGAVRFRMDVEPCIQRRLTQLHTLLDEWSRTGSFEAPKFIGGAPHAVMDFARFDAAQSAGLVALLSNEEQYEAGSIVTSLKNINDVQNDEGLPWARLKMLLSGAVNLTPTDRTVLRDALENAEYLDGRFRINAPQLVRRAAANGFQPDMSEVRQAIKYYSPTGHYTPSICLPLDASNADVARVTGQAAASSR